MSTGILSTKAMASASEIICGGGAGGGASAVFGHSAEQPATNNADNNNDLRMNCSPIPVSARNMRALHPKPQIGRKEAGSGYGLKRGADHIDDLIDLRFFNDQGRRQGNN